MDQAKALVEAAAAHEAEQEDLFGPVTPEEMVEAREALGEAAGHMAVLREARERKRGRPKGARNRRTDDFEKYILQFGQHPAITLMQIQSTPPEVLIEASKQPKVHSFRKNGKPNIVVERLSYQEAEAMRMRAAEALMPYLQGKKPIAVDLNFSGVSDLVIAGVTHTASEVQSIIEADFAPVPDGDDE
ncbi:hypothetical protein [Sphingobium sp. LSP13-1-1.1]|uniref:hypothetical protein n=1 Tax=Sphingobium sp. LSP13-1-1.1 TaxID=3135234 RepID=UPI003443FF53